MSEEKYKNPKSFYLCIDMGDLVYSLLYAKIKGVETYYIDTGCGRVKFNKESADFLLPLIKYQSFLKNVELYSGQEFDVDYGSHPQNKGVLAGTNLTIYHASKFGIDTESNDFKNPWLEAPKANKINKKIIVNRTSRYQGNKSFYFDFLKYINIDDILFAGLEQEYNEFCSMMNYRCDFYKAKDSLELAAVVNSVPIFLGNESLVCSIAKGLGKTCFVEYGRSAANYIFDRQNIFYF